MIRLHFSTDQVVNPRFGALPLTVVRLKGLICLRQKDGVFSPAREAIIDTGAFYCTFPRYVWERLQVHIIVEEVTFGGVNPRPECQIPAARGLVSGYLLDEDGRRTPELTFPAFLARTDHIPTILGFAGLLERFRLCFDYASDQAYVIESSHMPTGVNGFPDGLDQDDHRLHPMVK